MGSTPAVSTIMGKTEPGRLQCHPTVSKVGHVTADSTGFIRNTFSSCWPFEMPIATWQRAITTFRESAISFHFIRMQNFLSRSGILLISLHRWQSNKRFSPGPARRTPGFRCKWPCPVILNSAQDVFLLILTIQRSRRPLLIAGSKGVK